MLPFGPTLRQPDATSCGAACVVVARLLHKGLVPSAAGFTGVVLAEHRRLVGLHDARGRLQVPWPPALGTPPWAVARALSSLSGLTYAIRPVRRARGAAYDAVAAAVVTAPVALYVGSRLLPRHVVLALEVTDAGLRTYDPASGHLVTLTGEAFAGAHLGLAGWDVPWLAVSPAGRRTPP